MPIDTRDWYREEYRRKHPEEYGRMPRLKLRWSTGSFLIGVGVGVCICLFIFLML